MNRLLSNNLAGVRPESLPPRERRGPARVLFLWTNILGLKVLASQIEARTAARDDIDAVHVRLDSPLWLKVLGKSVHGVHGWDFHNFRHMVLWRRLIRRWLTGPLHLDHFDAVHICTQNKAWAIVDLKPKFPDMPFIIDIDATAAAEVRDFGYSHAARVPQIAAERRIFKAADLTLCWSQWARQSLIDDFGVPENKAEVSRVAIEIPAVNADVIRAGLDRSVLRIAFVGNDWERKGGPRLLRWHQERWKDRAELHVFSARAPRDPSAQRVVWHGGVPRDKLLTELLPHCDLFVLPTREDTLVLAAVEASGVGVPVVASRLAGLTEAVVDGRTGLLCPPKDDAAFIAAVESLMNDPARREAMSLAGRDYVAREWNPDVWYTRHLDRVVQLADERSREARR